MEPEYSNDSIIPQTNDNERGYAPALSLKQEGVSPPIFNEVMRLKHQIRELKAEIVSMRTKMEHARAILKSDQITPEQAEIKRVFNPTGLWNKYENSKSNY